MEINPNKYHIRFLKCGNGSKGGDAIVIRLFDTDDQQHIYVIDGGYKENGNEVVEYVNKYCKSTHIDFIINTHPDRDHISGIISILESDLTVGCIVMNRPWKDSGFTPEFFKDKRITENSLLTRIRETFEAADKVEELAKDKGVRIEKCFRGCHINHIFEFIGPSESHYKKMLIYSDKTPESKFNELNKPYVKRSFEDEEYDGKSFIEWFDDENTSEINETSIVTVLNLGARHFLFTGDVGKIGFEQALDYYDRYFKGGTSNFTYVQLPHHGSRKNINPDIINRFDTPKYIISCPPEGEAEGHPSQRLINKILQLQPDAEIYRTGDTSFNIHNGLDLKFNTQIKASWNGNMDGRSK